MHWNDVWFGRGIGQTSLRTVLVPASWLYAAGWSAYAGIYRLGWKHAAHPHCPIVCVGNLTVGGSGKTPAVLYIARIMQSMGYDVTIGCSGYGSPSSKGAALAPTGDLNALRWGDEAALFRWQLPHVPLVVGRDRVRAAELCHEAYPESVLLMDDGFQHLPLTKDLAILLDPPLQNQLCLPAGPYREPRDNRNRADLALPDGFAFVSSPPEFMDARTGLSAIRPPAANVLCAIGSPDRFFEAIRAAGTHIGKAVALPDHDSLQAKYIFSGLPAEEPLIVTAKDWVKLRERDDLSGRSITIADYQVLIEPEDSFAHWLRKKIDEVRQKAN